MYTYTEYYQLFNVVFYQSNLPSCRVGLLAILKGSEHHNVRSEYINMAKRLFIVLVKLHSLSRLLWFNLFIYCFIIFIKSIKICLKEMFYEEMPAIMSTDSNDHKSKTLLTCSFMLEWVNGSQTLFCHHTILSCFVMPAMTDKQVDTCDRWEELLLKWRSVMV